MGHSKSDPELESQVRAALSFLFVEHGAQVVSNKRLPGTGNSQIFMRVLNFDLRIIQNEGSLSVLAAPDHTPNGWQPIESLLKAIEPNGNFPPPPVYGSLTELGSLLQPRLMGLNHSLSRERFATTVQEARQARTKELIALTPRTPVPTSSAMRVAVGAVREIAQVVRFLNPTAKDRYDKFLPIGADKQFEELVRHEFNTVFRRFGAHINSSGRFRIMDFAFVTFAAGNLRVRAVRDRGCLEISVAPIHSPRNWHSLGTALLALEGHRELSQSVPSSDLRGAGRLLEAGFVRLNEAFSESRYPVIDERIREYSEGLKQTWVQDFNQKHRFYRATIS